jgi:hypothetical protein
LFVFATSSPLHRKIGLGNSKRNAIRVAAASVVGLSERSMYRLLENFQNNGYLLSESKIGKHERKWINNNEVSPPLPPANKSSIYYSLSCMCVPSYRFGGVNAETIFEKMYAKKELQT